MKHFIILFSFIPLLIFSQENFNYKRDFENILKETKNNKSDIYYGNLLERYNKIDTTLTDKQILSLLIGFTSNKFYKPYKDISFGRNLYKLNDENKFDQVIKDGNEFLKNHPFDIKTLYEVSYAYYKKSNKEFANAYLVKARMIFKSMIYSGDAKSIDNAAFALNSADGQDFINKAMRANIGKMGSGQDKNGYFIDILDANLEDGSTETLYFIIPHATKKMFE
ncbi:DUF4919 domain-containing protein [Chryseobacterium polytrichastri]|uniref:DUF4919 domain-containing protein n=1 Tax=Chryseobacterium polytrichastri TaxID=1302687 RepID=A0A1M6V4S9_9FLAO|nr:DUF4919 domain-containing protein [Chryseobacterium polytrichastri]SHK76371.1 protein of unknown function [Chryseobacterium polytrichastri]